MMRFILVGVTLPTFLVLNEDYSMDWHAIQNLEQSSRKVNAATRLGEVQGE